LTALADLLQTHVARQEALLFPKIRHLREPVGETAWVCQTADSVTELMDRSIADDREAMDLLGRVEACLRETAWRDRGCLVEQLAEDLRELHQDLAEHFRIEHELLFPAVRDAQAEGLAV
jgi:iron-sulfur cluster repair protein YtfE (RIC family)